MRDSDPDFRIVATDDLMKGLSDNTLKLAESDEGQVTQAVMRLLADTNGEVQNRAVQWYVSVCLQLHWPGGSIGLPWFRNGGDGFRAGCLRHTPCHVQRSPNLNRISGVPRGFTPLHTGVCRHENAFGAGNPLAIGGRCDIFTW